MYTSEVQQSARRIVKQLQRYGIHLYIEGNYDLTQTEIALIIELIIDDPPLLNIALRQIAKKYNNPSDEQKA